MVSRGGDDQESNTFGRLIGKELFPSPSIYHCLCSLNRCYFFLRFTVSFPTDERFPPGVVGGSPTIFWLPRRDSTSSNTGVGFVVVCSLFWILHICMWRPDRDFVPPHTKGLQDVFVSLFVFLSSFLSHRPSLYSIP